MCVRGEGVCVRGGLVRTDHAAVQLPPFQTQPRPQGISYIQQAKLSGTRNKMALLKSSPNETSHTQLLVPTPRPFS